MPPQNDFPTRHAAPAPSERLAAEVERRLVYVRAMRGLARRPALTRVAAVVAEVAAEVGGKPPAPRTVAAWCRRYEGAGRDPAALIPVLRSRGTATPVRPVRMGDGAQLPDVMGPARPAKPGTTPDHGVVSMTTPARTVVPEQRRSRQAPHRRAAEPAVDPADAPRRFGRIDGARRPDPRLPEGAVRMDIVRLRDASGETADLALAWDRGGRPFGAALGRSLEAGEFVRLLHGGVSAAGVEVIGLAALAPTAVLVDNAREFHSASFREAAHALGVSIHYVPTGASQRHPSERLLRKVAAHMGISGIRGLAEHLRRWLDPDGEKIAATAG